jgi:hypothetical protein
MDYITLLAVVILSTMVLMFKRVYRGRLATPARLSTYQTSLALHITDTTRSTGRHF